MSAISLSEGPESAAATLTLVLCVCAIEAVAVSAKMTAITINLTQCGLMLFICSALGFVAV